MKIKQEVKFAINEKLKPVADTTGLIKMQVVEIVIQKCYAATQLHYCCRIYTQSVEGATPSITKTLFQCTEPELENWCEWHDNNNKS